MCGTSVARSRARFGHIVTTFLHYNVCLGNGSMTDREQGKKRSERARLEAARRLTLSVLPDGDIADFESPDFRLPDSRIGIEIADLLPIGGAELATFQYDVVRSATLKYEKS